MSHSSNSNMNDPRQPLAAKPFKPPMVAPQDLPVDYSGFIAVVFGIAGVMFRYKLSSWLAIIFCAQSLANMRNMENDLKQISMAMIGIVGVYGVGIAVHQFEVTGILAFAIMGLVTNYFGPTRPAPPK